MHFDVEFRPDDVVDVYASPPAFTQNADWQKGSRASTMRRAPRRPRHSQRS